MIIKPIILVVEDHPIIRLNAVELFIHAGFGAIGARDADEALQILEARLDIRLVFTDVEMPGTMDGIKLAHCIRARWPQVYLIVASGRRMVEQDELPPATKFFAKPYDDRSILAEINNVLSVNNAAWTSH